MSTIPVTRDSTMQNSESMPMVTSMKKNTTAQTEPPGSFNTTLKMIMVAVVILVGWWKMTMNEDENLRVGDEDKARARVDNLGEKKVLMESYICHLDIWLLQCVEPMCQSAGFGNENETASKMLQHLNSHQKGSLVQPLNMGQGKPSIKKNGILWIKFTKGGGGWSDGIHKTYFFFFISLKCITMSF